MPSSNILPLFCYWLLHFAMSIFFDTPAKVLATAAAVPHAVLQCSHKLIPMGAFISCCGVLLTAAAVL